MIHLAVAPDLRARFAVWPFGNYNFTMIHVNQLIISSQTELER